MAIINDKTMPHLFNHRVVKCGDYYEYRKYETPHLAGFKREYKVVRRAVSERRADNVERAKRTLVRTVLANSSKVRPLFVTLTYRENQCDRDRAVSDVRGFLRDLRETHGDIQYVYTLERQERGAWHCHMLIFNYMFIDVGLLRAHWQNVTGDDGNVNIKKTNDTHHVAFYIAKYLGKDFENPGKRYYSVSRNLKTPEEVRSYYTHIPVTASVIRDYGFYNPFTHEWNELIIYYDDRSIVPQLQQS